MIEQLESFIDAAFNSMLVESLERDTQVRNLGQLYSVEVVCSMTSFTDFKNSMVSLANEGKFSFEELKRMSNQRQLKFKDIEFVFSINDELPTSHYQCNSFLKS